LHGNPIAGFKKVKRMTRSRLVLLGLFLCFQVSVFAQQASAPPGTAEQTARSPSQSDPVLVLRPSPRSSKPLGAVTPEGRIHLDVLVSDAAGKPVLGLEPSDFKLLDDNQPRRILSFRSFDGINVKPDPPIEVILLFDFVNIPFQEVAFVRSEAERFLRQNAGRLAQPVFIFLLSESGLRVQPRPSLDGNAEVTVLDQIKGSLKTVYPVAGAEADLRHVQVSLKQIAAVAENEALKPGRKLLLWVGPGWPVLESNNFSFSDPMLESNNFSFSDKDQRRYFDAIVELSTRLREARMAVYSVAPSNVDSNGVGRFLYQDFLKGVTSAKKADIGNLALKVLVNQSGGRSLGPDNDLVAQINACIAESNAFYTISFNPPAAEHADEYHQLKVEVAQPGVTVRTTAGYYNQPPLPTVAPSQAVQ
jgi:VWFA-related protein